MTITRKGSHGEEEFHSPLTDGFDTGEGASDAASEVTTDAPIHPVPSMQAAFEESIDESADDHDGANASSTGNAEARRQTLLEAQKYDESWQARWRQRRSSKHHPLLKLVSQIVFGLHLLQQQQAKSEGEVVKILQSHVNEVDTFLEKTAEDFELAVTDIEERVRHLKLPMEHKGVFETMLDHQAFRTQLLDGNEKIESIINRTSRAKDASLYDLREGTRAVKELQRYLDTVRDQWPKDKRVISEVFDAMRGNERGWARYIADLQEKANTLRQNLDRLGASLSEMSRMAEAAVKRRAGRSRNASYGSSKSAPNSPGLRPKGHGGFVPPMPSSQQSDKPLPPLRRDQNGLSSVGDGAKDMSKAQPLPRATKPERPRELPQFQPNRDPRSGSTTSTEPQRPRTAGATGAVSRRLAREADSRADTAALADFFRDGRPAPQSVHVNPQRSHPPDPNRRAHGDSARSLKDDNALRPTRSNGQTPATTRSKSQGAIDIMAGADQARSNVPVVKGRESTSTRDSEALGDKSLSPSTRTGFARRLSKRMKHLPSQDDLASSKPAEQAHPDSAYASSPSTSKSSPEQKLPRAEDGLGPLPSKGIEPLYASKVTERAEQNQMPPPPTPHNREMGRDGTNQSVRSLAPTSKSRGSTIKGMFQRKWSSGRKMFAT